MHPSSFSLEHRASTQHPRFSTSLLPILKGGWLQVSASAALGYKQASLKIPTWVPSSGVVLRPGPFRGCSEAQAAGRVCITWLHTQLVFLPVVLSLVLPWFISACSLHIFNSSFSIFYMYFMRKYFQFSRIETVALAMSRDPASKLLLLRQADFYSLQNCECGFQAYLLGSFSNVHCSCTVHLQFLLHMLIRTYIYDVNE